MTTKSLIKSVSATAAMVLLTSGGLHANTNYDPSTTIVKSKPLTKQMQSSPLALPRIHTATVVEGMIEARDYADSTSQRFRFKFDDNSAKRKGPFIFEGGNLDAFSSTVRGQGLYAEILSGNTLAISSTKYFKVGVDNWELKSLAKKLKSTRNISNVTVNGGNAPSARFSATAQSYKVALSIISSHNNKARAIRDKDIAEAQKKEDQKNALLAQQANTSSVDGISASGKVPSTQAGTYTSGTAEQLPNLNGTITLDQPYTVKTLIKKMERTYGGKYDVRVDSNIPVNKKIEIKKVEDLNRYLTNTTGQSLKFKKNSSGVIVVEKK